MADNDVQVTFGASTGQLIAGVNQAKAAIAGVGASVDQLKATLAGMEALYARLGDAGKASLAPQIAALQQEIAAASGATQAVAGVAAAAERGAGAISTFGRSTGTAAREFRALFDEFSSGRFYQAPSTIAILAQRVFGLSTPLLIAGGAVAGLGYALYKLAGAAAAAENALDAIKIGAKFAGDIDLTTEAIDRLKENITGLSSLSSSTAGVITGSFSHIRNVTEPLLTGLTSEIGDYATASGESAKKVAQGWTKAFSDPIRFGHQFVASLAGVTQAQIDTVDAARRAGDANGTAAAMLEALNAALQRARPAIDEHNRAIGSSIANTALYTSEAEAGVQADTISTAVLQEQNAERAKQIGLIKEAIAALQKLPQGSNQTMTAGVGAALAEDKTSAQLLTVQGHIAEINRALAAAKASGDQVNVDRLDRGLAAAKEHLDQLQFGPVMERARAEIGAMEATWTGSHTQMLAAERDIWARYLAQVRSGSKEALSIQQNMDRDTTAVHREAATEQLRSLESVTEEAKRGSAQRIAAARQEVAYAVATYGQGSTQAIAAERQLTEAIQAEAHKREATAEKTIQTEIRVLRTGLQEKITLYSSEAAQFQITQNQKFALIENEANKEYEAERALLASKLALNKDYANKIALLDAQHAAQMVKLNEQAIAEQQKEWTTYLSTIESSFNSQLRGLLAGTTTWSQAFKKILGDLIIKFIEMCETMVVKWAAAQLAQTTAATTGAAARAAAEQTASSAGMLSMVANAVKAIMTDAAQAFGGVFAFLAPVMGPAAAGPAAAASATVSAAAVFDVGTPEILRTGLAVVHQGEAIVPAWARGSGPYSGAGAGGAPQVHAPVSINVSALDSQSVSRFFNDNSKHMLRAINDAVKRGAHVGLRSINR